MWLVLSLSEGISMQIQLPKLLSCQDRGTDPEKWKPPHGGRKLMEMNVGPSPPGQTVGPACMGPAAASPRSECPLATGSQMFKRNAERTGRSALPPTKWRQSWKCHLFYLEVAHLER